MARVRSASPSINSVETPTPLPSTNGGSNLAYSPAKRQLPSVPIMQQSEPSQIMPPRQAPLPPSSAPREVVYTPAPALSSSSDPVAQLSQMTLERRSSKRFSENYLAQLTSSPNSDRSAKLSVNDVRKHLQRTISIPETIEDDDTIEAVDYSASRAYSGPLTQLPASNHMAAVGTQRSSKQPAPTYRTIEHPTLRSPEIRSGFRTSAELVVERNGDKTESSLNTIAIFIRKGDRTKRATIATQQVSKEKVYSIVENLFGSANAEDQLYIEDAESKVMYELETDTDIRDRSVIMVKTSTSGMQTSNKDITESSSTSDLRTWLDQRLEKLEKEIAEISMTHPSLPSQADEAKLKPDIETRAILNVDGKVIEDEKKVDSSAVEEALKVENEKLKSQLAEALTALQTVSTADPPSIVVSANRDHVMSMSARHEHRGTELTAKLEEAMNVMERIRKDVLQRKVTPRPQQLADLSKDFEDIEKESGELAENLVLLDAASNKLWEEELTIITAEQDALEYQRAFIDDIKADLEQSLSSLSTIKQVEEQKRFGGVTSIPMMLETSTDPSRAIKFVQADIKSLQINHERRTEAIADAERQRIKEREYLMENEFKKELGAFVGSNNLKKTGGAEEIERMRAEKDDAHRKAIFSKQAPDDSDRADETPTNVAESDPTEPEATTIDSPSLPQGSQDLNDPSTSEASEKPRAVSGSASILAKIDASRGFDALERRRSSLMKHVPSNESLTSRGKPDREERDSIREDDNIVPEVEQKGSP